MTANELADYLESMADDVGHEGYHRSALVLKFEAPQLIRQQQALIEQLEKTQDYLYKTHDADKAEIERLTMLCDCMTTESNRKGNEIEELKVKAHEWYLIAMEKAQEK